MKIENHNIYNPKPPAFKGYDARALKGFIMRYTTTLPQDFSKIAAQLQTIGKKQNFDVFVQGHNQITSKNLSSLVLQDSPIRGGSKYTWAQDNITCLPDNILLNPTVLNEFNVRIANLLGIKFKPDHKYTHTAGGNYFIMDKNGERELLVGSFSINDIPSLRKKLDINSVRIIPQSDFHLDLFIRPLKDKVILLADDKIWLDRVNETINKIETDRNLKNNLEIQKVMEQLKKLKPLINIMNIDIPHFPYKPLKMVEDVLLNSGYKVVRVPGRIFKHENSHDGIIPNHMLNYMNAIVHINPEGELVYITNKSNLNKECGITEEIGKKINFDFDSEFINSVKDYIKPQNLYFVETQKFLKDYDGGIHCLCAEIPNFNTTKQTL